MRTFFAGPDPENTGLFFLCVACSALHLREPLTKLVMCGSVDLHARSSYAAPDDR